MYNLGQNQTIGGRFTKMRVPPMKHLKQLRCDVAYLQRAVVASPSIPSHINSERPQYLRG